MGLAGHSSMGYGIVSFGYSVDFNQSIGYDTLFPDNKRFHSICKGAVKKQPAKNGGFQKWDPPLAFSVHFA